MCMYVDRERLADDVAHRHARVQRRVRILEHDLQLTADLAHLLALVVRDVTTVDDDPSRGRLDQLEDRSSKGRFAAAGLTDQPECLPVRDPEVDTVDGVHLTDGSPHEALADGKVLDEVLNLENRVLRGRVDGYGGDRLAHTAAPESLER